MRVEPRRMAVLSLVSPCKTLSQKTNQKNGHCTKAVPVVIGYQCFQSGEARLAPTRDILLFHNPIRLRCTIFSSEAQEVET